MVPGMSWRDWLGGRSRKPAPPGNLRRTFLLEGDELVEAVGESFYQPALLTQCGARPGDAVRFPCRASLVAQPDNPYDRNAVAVQISGELVGHLARHEAPHWQSLVRAPASHGYLATCEAMIAGRGPEGETANLGVFLHLPTLEEARVQVTSLGI
jgi:hypothetical protein